MGRVALCTAYLGPLVVAFLLVAVPTDAACRDVVRPELGELIFIIAAALKAEARGKQGRADAVHGVIRAHELFR
jgi:hypothetical protein